ncbi:hypothetical protein C8Q79DRAFT_996230 [Trametes meyenii]|nr:hypothetical protein C8Q79DRAFT_996230 [Trametes meyenii]
MSMLLNLALRAYNGTPTFPFNADPTQQIDRAGASRFIQFLQRGERPPQAVVDQILAEGVDVRHTPLLPCPSLFLSLPFRHHSIPGSSFRSFRTYTHSPNIQPPSPSVTFARTTPTQPEPTEPFAQWPNGDTAPRTSRQAAYIELLYAQIGGFPPFTAPTLTQNEASAMIADLRLRAERVRLAYGKHCV